MNWLSDMFAFNERLEEWMFRLTQIDYKNFDTLIEYYRYCVTCDRGGWTTPLYYFKLWFPEESKYINSMMHKRYITKRNIEFMLWLKKDGVYFGDLTFDDKRIDKDDSLKRKMAQRHLNKYFEAYMLFEEHGTQNTCRYHVHFVGVLKSEFKAKDVRDNWPCFSKCKYVHSSRGVARYLTDYTTKQVPRIRRNKKLVELESRYNKVQYQSKEECNKFCAEMSEMFDNLPF